MTSHSPSEFSIDDTDIEKFHESDRINVKVIASGLQKKYPNGKVAVNDFSLAMAEGQITCLLGTYNILVLTKCYSRVLKGDNLLVCISCSPC